jgi:two-component system, OmpR family, response regulator
VKDCTLSRILYVEDEPDIRLIARMALQEIGGLSVEIASSGSEALSMIEANPPDLILLDVMMPGLSGPSTLKLLRANPLTADIPVIFMTAKVQPHEVLEYKSLGAWEVIPKPFDPVALSDQVKGIWEANVPSRAS